MGDDATTSRVLVVGDARFADRITSALAADKLVVLPARADDEALRQARASAGFLSAAMIDSDFVRVPLPLGRALRRLVPRMPVLLFAETHGDFMNSAVSDGFLVALKSIEAAQLREFVDSVRARHPDARIARAVNAASERYRLTDAEEFLLRLAVTGTPRAELSRAVGVAESSIKSRVRSIVQKMGAGDLYGAVRLVLLDALRYT